MEMSGNLHQPAEKKATSSLYVQNSHETNAMEAKRIITSFLASRNKAISEEKKDKASLIIKDSHLKNNRRQPVENKETSSSYVQNSDSTNDLEAKRIIESFMANGNKAEGSSDRQESLTDLHQSVEEKAVSSSVKTSDDKCELETNQILSLKELKISSESLILVKKTKHHTIYRTADGRHGLKILRSKSTVHENVNRLMQENKVVKLVQHHGFRMIIGRTLYRNKDALAIEWFDGSTIADIIEERDFNTMEFLIIAKEIVSALVAMHEKNILHLNLNCDHILIKDIASVPCVKIIGCGFSSSTSENNYISNDNLTEYDLRCISPEQTGRINRKVGIRSDFYSLGIIFYRILTKQYPHESDNILKLIHLHILQDTPSVSSIKQDIPIPISNMVSKLMCKDPDDRYQSAKGILHDLYLMIAEYDSDKSLKSVDLQKHDISDTFLMRQKLYGRCTEYDTLTSVFNKTISGSFQTVFVTGSSGVGKSALVQELYKHVAIKNGIFACGKHDVVKSEPYGALIQAVDNICKNLLLDSQATLDRYRCLIQNAVGEEGKLLTNVIPCLQLIIGAQQGYSDAYGNEAKYRFNYVFIKFIKALTSSERPIVLILEDLHWIDSASSDLLSSIVDEKIRNIMLIGAYRDDEVNDTHLVSQLLQKINKLKIGITEIKVNNMNCDTVNEMISDTLCASLVETYSLSAMIHEKTKGSPFYVYQMLTSLFEQNLIKFCNEKSKWEWDERSLIDKTMAKNVRELLKNKILSFDKEVVQALKTACCLGSPFSMPILRMIVNSSKAIDGAKNTGMIIQCEGNGTSYRFAHDQIQHAVYDLLPVNQRNTLYLCIGKKMWRKLPENDLDEHLFTIANLLQPTIHMETEEGKRIKMAVLFMQAGKKAMSSTAFELSLQYLETGLKLLNADSWMTNFDLSLQLHDLAAKMAYSLSKYEKMNKLLNTISSHATSSIHLAQSDSLKIRLHNDKREFAEAIRVGISSVNKLGEHIKLSFSDANIATEIKLVRDLLYGISDETIANLPEMKNETSLSTMMILNDIICSSFFVNPRLLPLITSRMIHITYKDGISKYSAGAFCLFGVTLCINDDKLAYRFGNLAFTLLGRIPAKELVPHITSAFYQTINPYYASIHASLDPLLKAYEICLEVGLLEGSINCSNSYMVCAFNSGRLLRKLSDDLECLREQIPIQTPFFKCTDQIVSNLLDCRTIIDHHGYLSGKNFDYNRCFEKKADGTNERVAVLCASIAYLFHDYHLAKKFIDVCREGVAFIRTFYLYPIFIFYDGLISLHFAKHSENKETWLKDTDNSILKLRKMSENGSENFLNKLRLLEAEKAVVCNDETIYKNFSEAISLSRNNNFPQEEGLACERAAIYYMEKKFTEIASRFIIQAWGCYEKWGAIAKLKHLQKIYKPYLSEVSLSDSNNLINSDMQIEEDSRATVSVLTTSTSDSFYLPHENKRSRIS